MKLLHLIKNEIKTVMKENDSEDGRLKNATSILGLKLDRVVIEGNAVAENVPAILKLASRHDRENTLKYYPATGKIVGVMATSKVQALRKDVVLIDKSIKVQIKPRKLT